MRLVILGAGGHGQTVADIAKQTGRYSEILFLDDKAETAVGRCSEYINFKDDSTEMYPAFGNNQARLEWEKRLQEEGMALAKIIHPLAYVSPTAAIEDGCVVLPHAVINTGTVVKMSCIIDCGAIVDHGCVIEEGVHVSPGAVVKAENRIASCTKIESGEVISIRQYPI